MTSQSAPAGRAAGDIHILVVDDDPDNRHVFTRMLQLAGYTVRTARHGREALAVAEEERPDLILLDLSMPQLDGWSTARALKAQPRLQQVPIIAVTAHALQGAEAHAREAGCDAYLSKPIAMQELLAAVAHYLSAPPAERTAGRPAL